MKKSVYKDYTKASDYFVDDKESLKEDIKATEKQKKFLVWVQEFSKKIVTTVFILFVFSTIINIYFVYMTINTGLVSGIDTLISETNQTFREIIGGYLIKSAVENSVKIGGNYYVGICDAKLRAMNQKLDEKLVSESKHTSNNTDNFDYNQDVDA